jgi:hypothetical protein
MSENIWRIYGEGPKKEDNPKLILQKYAKDHSPSTKGQFKGVVTENIKEDSGEVIYALYVLVPKLRDYMYRLFEVKIENCIDPYPLELKFFAKDPKNHKTYSCDTAKDYENRLVNLIQSDTTANILKHLQTLIEIKEEYKD